LEGELENVFNEADKSKKEINNIAKIKQDMDRLETLYFAAVINMIENLPNTKKIAPSQYESIKSKAKNIIDAWTKTKAKTQKVIKERTDNDAKIAEKVYAQLFPNELIENLTKVIETPVEPQPETFNLAGTWIYENNTLAVSEDGRLTVFEKDPNKPNLPPKYKTYYYTYNPQTGDIVTEDKDGKKTNIKIQWINKDKFNWTSQYGTKNYTRSQK
jgi:hypothetical protein